ncbi:MAG: Ig domain-containing protein [Lachnospiraceae bacterium]|nr:Ig domain-containing protein [Lachnospiraceae bacterium]
MKNGKRKLRKWMLGILLVFSFSMLATEVIPMADVPVTVEAAKVKINAKKATLIKGQTKTLKVTGTKKKVKWSTDKKSVAAVTQKGKVTAKKKGKATITAKVDGKKYKCVITVEEPRLNKQSISVNVGKTQTLKVLGTKQKITWSSSDKKIAKVSNKGEVRGIKKGNAVITAKVSNKKYKCRVTVKTNTVEVTKVSLNKNEAELDVGDTLQLRATVSPSNATDKTVTWSSSDSSVASVSSRGLITAKSEGTAYIYAKAGNKKATCVVDVWEEEEAEKPQIKGELLATKSPASVLGLILTNEGDLPLTVEDYYLLITGNSQTSLWLVDSELDFIDSYTIDSGEEEMLLLCRSNFGSFPVSTSSECCFVFWYDGVKYFADVEYTGGGYYEVYDESDASAASISIRKANALDTLIEPCKSTSKEKVQKLDDILKKIEKKK